MGTWGMVCLPRLSFSSLLRLCIFKAASDNGDTWSLRSPLKLMLCRDLSEAYRYQEVRKSARSPRSLWEKVLRCVLSFSLWKKI